MKYLQPILGRIAELFHFFDKDNGHNRLFPKKINNYTLNRLVRFKTSLSGYGFAIYKYGKKEAFAKAWFGNYKNHLYFDLINEIETYKFLQPNNPDLRKIGRYTFGIPKFLDSIIENKRIILLTENINGSTNIPDSEIVDVYDEAIKYIRALQIPEKLRNQMKVINKKYISISLVIAVVIAIIHRPKLIRLIIDSYHRFNQNWQNIGAKNWSTLVHRDLRDSLIKSGKNIYIIDWQLASLSNSYLEFAQLFVIYFENGKLNISFDKFKEVAKATKSELLLFRNLIIYTIIIEMAFTKTKTLKDEELIMQYSQK